MNDEEKLVWMLAYTVALNKEVTGPNIVAIHAVEDFRKAQRYFNKDHYPPEK